MIASQLYEQITGEIDKIQKAIMTHARDQVQLSHHLADLQAQSKGVMAIMRMNGDRELTGQEVLTLTPKTNVNR